MSHLPKIMETASGEKYALKVVNIGDWDMDTTDSVSVAHGLTLSTIRMVFVIIRNDADTGRYEILGKDGTSVAANISEINTTNVVVERRATDFFDSADFDSTSYNRGWIHLWYLVS